MFKLSHKWLGLAVLLTSLLGPMTASADCNLNAQQSTPADDFVIKEDGTVLHKVTGLMWKRCPEGLSSTNCVLGSAKGYEWSEALEFAIDHSFAGYNDWRLPNIKELASIVETSCSSPAINSEVFPYEDGTFTRYFWSSSPSGNTRALRVSFGTEGNIWNDGRNFSYRVRLVRDTQ